MIDLQLKIDTIIIFNPALAYECVQVKYLPNQLEIYYEEGTHIMTITRISGKLGLRYINWSTY